MLMTKVDDENNILPSPYSRKCHEVGRRGVQSLGLSIVTATELR